MFGSAAAPFDAFEREAHRELMSEYGVVFAHIPMRSIPNRSPVRDDSRPIYSLRGVFDWESKSVRLGLKEMDVSSRDPQVTFHRCDLLHPIKRGDLLKHCALDLTFEVRDTQPDSYSGIVCDLLQMGVTDQ